MEIAVPHPDFQRQRLSVRTAGFFSGPVVLVDGQPIKRVKNKFTLLSDAGREVTAELKNSVFDPVPQIKIGDETLALVPKLTWHQYAWNGLPIILLFVGGGLGALIGMSAVYANTRVFRSNRSVGLRYTLTALLTLGSGLLFFLLAGVIHILVNGVPQ